jgi:hypothetical protein
VVIEVPAKALGPQKSMVFGLIVSSAVRRLIHRQGLGKLGTWHGTTWTIVVVGFFLRARRSTDREHHVMVRIHRPPIGTSIETAETLLCICMD